MQLGGRPLLVQHPPSPPAMLASGIDRPGCGEVRFLRTWLEIEILSILSIFRKGKSRTVDKAEGARSRCMHGYVLSGS